VTKVYGHIIGTCSKCSSWIGDLNPGRYCVTCGQLLPDSINRLRKTNVLSQSEQTKKCPYCSEVIKVDAVECRFCRCALPAAVSDIDTEGMRSLPLKIKSYG
jgi:hypothetical protein